MISFLSVCSLIFACLIGFFKLLQGGTGYSQTNDNLEAKNARPVIQVWEICAVVCLSTLPRGVQSRCISLLFGTVWKKI